MLNLTKIIVIGWREMSQIGKDQQNIIINKNVKEGKPLQVSSFIILSILLCITNLTIMARLYQFNGREDEAERFYRISKINHLGDQEVNNNQTFSAIFMAFKYETYLLLPLLLEISAILIIIFKWPYHKIFQTILVSVVMILISFLALWLYPDQFYTYKITFVLHSLFLVPLLISSSFGLIKLIPKQMLRFKGYYVCFMLMLPGFGIPCTYWYMQQLEKFEEEDSFQAMYGIVLKMGTVGLLVSLVTLYFMFDIRKDIIYTLDMRLIQAIKSQNYGVQNKDDVKNKLKNTMSTQQFSRKQTTKIFDKKQSESPSEISIREKKQTISMPIDKFGGILILWGLIAAIGRQLPDIQKKIVKSIPKIQSQVYALEDHSNIADEVLFNLVALLISLALTWIVRRKIQMAMKLIMTCILSGLISILILLLLSQGTLVFSVSNIEKFVTLARSCFLAFIIPGLVYSETVGMPASQAATILFLSSWAAELLMRIILGEMRVDTTLYLMGIVILISCYAIQQIRKGTQTYEIASWEYGKIGEDDSSAHIEMAQTLEQPNTFTEKEKKTQIQQN